MLMSLTTHFLAFSLISWNLEEEVLGNDTGKRDWPSSIFEIPAFLCGISWIFLHLLNYFLWRVKLVGEVVKHRIWPMLTKQMRILIEASLNSYLHGNINMERKKTGVLERISRIWCPLSFAAKMSSKWRESWEDAGDRQYTVQKQKFSFWLA